jgi:hypothetical protein
VTPAGWYADPADSAQLRWWDGQQWTEHVHPAQTVQSTVQHAHAQVPAMAAAGAASAFAPTSQLVGGVGYQQSAPATGFAGSQECQVCGASPARQSKFSSLRGLVVFFVARTHKGRWCRDCAEAQYRNAQAFTLGWGWWGFITLFLTPVTLLLNLLEQKKARAVGVPVNRRAPALSLGKPVSQRPQFYVMCAVIVFLVISILAGN